MEIRIFRGLPGAGKTTFIEETFDPDEIEVFRADDWHMFDGVYKYDPKNAGYAHDQCFKCFLTAATVEKMTPYLIVDNTNTTLVELAPYVRVATALEISYKIIYIMCDPIIAMKRNVHGVPASTILSMHKNLLTEIVPTYWNQEVVFDRPFKGEKKS